MKHVQSEVQGVVLQDVDFLFMFATNISSRFRCI